MTICASLLFCLLAYLFFVSLVDDRDCNVIQEYLKGGNLKGSSLPRSKENIFLKSHDSRANVFQFCLHCLIIRLRKKKKLYIQRITLSIDYISEVQIRRSNVNSPSWVFILNSFYSIFETLIPQFRFFTLVLREILFNSVRLRDFLFCIKAL